MILDRYLVRQYLPMFVASLGMFMFLLSLIDLFANLVRYLNNDVPFSQILKMNFYFLPKSLSYALPISLLFASAYTLGDLYARNELTSVFSSGIPFWRFSLPLVFIGLFATVFSFFFDDMVVIPTLRVKNEMSRRFLQQTSENDSDIVIKSRNGQLIYSVEYYDYQARILTGVIIVEQDSRGDIISIIRTRRATWSGEYWEFADPVIYYWDNADGLFRIKSLPPTEDYTEQPDTFRRHAVKSEELPFLEVRLLVQDLKAAGLPFIDAQADYYHRVSFSVVSLIVMILSISMGGRFRKNIMLMSLLTSLGSAVVFYVIEMITMMMGRLGYIPPAVGAWFPVIIFIILGLLMVRGAKT
jgi:lipopolysaccharide export system permease protein